jgi:hypothetical protein
MQWKQELLIREMEKSIERRETIAAASRVRARAYPTQQLNKEICVISRALKRTIADMRTADQDLVSIENAGIRQQKHKEMKTENLRILSLRQKAFTD